MCKSFPSSISGSGRGLFECQLLEIHAWLKQRKKNIAPTGIRRQHATSRTKFDLIGWQQPDLDRSRRNPV
jgi:hypothetical protein